MSENIREKIRDFKNLEKGWCYGDGVGFQDSVITKAVQLHDEFVLQGFTEIDAFPGSNGEIGLIVYLSTFDFLELVIDDEVVITHENEDDILNNHTFSFEESIEKIRNINK